MLDSLSLLICVGAGLVGGVFFAFSAFVMKALAQLPAAQGILAMQRINVVVLNPLFLGTFVGTAVLAGGLSYLLGSFGVTMAFNVPRNDRLARLAAESAEAAACWPNYVREWLFWNHLRTVASVACAACAAGALAC